MSEENIDGEVITSIIDKLLECRRDRRVKDADNLKRVLQNDHSVQVFYRRDGSIGWSKVVNQPDTKLPTEKIAWSEVHISKVAQVNEEYSDIPLVIATVDTPYYRSRLDETVHHLNRAQFEDGTSFRPIETIDMLNILNHPLIGASRIVYEGWRKILLPALSSSDFALPCPSILFIAEDDVRLCHVSPGRMKDHCKSVFDANPDIHILSLGHSYTPAKLSRRQRRRAKRQLQTTGVADMNSADVEVKKSTTSSSLLQHVNSGKGLHGSTLLALRHPEGTQSLLTTMEAVPMGKRCHFDQFLFHSTMHNIGVAFSDPPLVGWAEVSETLTSVGSGCRRNGGGRLAQRPGFAVNIKWVCRQLS
jgi:hypothetical protein